MFNKEYCNSLKKPFIKKNNHNYQLVTHVQTYKSMKKVWILNNQNLNCFFYLK